MPDFGKLLTEENEFHETLKKGSPSQQCEDLAGSIADLESESKRKSKARSKAATLAPPLESAAARHTQLREFRARRSLRFLGGIGLVPVFLL